MKALSYDLINGGVAKTNEIIIDGKTPVTSDTFSKKNKTYIISTKINPSSETTYLVGENSVLQFTKNGQFGENCIIDSETPLEIDAGLHKIFDGRVVAMIKNPVVYPEWWGAVGDGITDDVVAINKCIVAAKRNTVFLGQSFYRIKSTSIIIDETEAEIEKYEPLGLSYPEGTSETFWVWQDLSGKEEKSRKIIINGCLIGDEDLVGPVIYINGFTRSKLYVHTIYVRSTSPGSCGIYLGNSSKMMDIHVQAILKEKEDRTGGATINHTGEGSGFVCGSGCQTSHLTIDRIEGFRYGFVLCDGQARSTYVDTSGVGLTGTTTKASHMVNRFDFGIIQSINAMVWDLRISGNNGSYINCNKFTIQELSPQGGKALMISNSTAGKCVGNTIEISAPDCVCTKFFDISGLDGSKIIFHGNVQDIQIASTNQRVTQSLNTENAKVFKFTKCYNTEIIPTGNVFLECFEIDKCTNLIIKNGYFCETTTNSNTSQEVHYGLTTQPLKAIFDAEGTIVEDNLIAYNGITTNSTTTPALILQIRPRWKSRVQTVTAVSDIPTVSTTTHLYYVITDTEYGTNIKLYPIYDSLKRQLGYVYKDEYVTT